MKVELEGEELLNEDTLITRKSTKTKKKTKKKNKKDKTKKKKKLTKKNKRLTKKNKRLTKKNKGKKNKGKKNKGKKKKGIRSGSVAGFHMVSPGEEGYSPYGDSDMHHGMYMYTDDAAAAAEHGMDQYGHSLEPGHHDDYLYPEMMSADPDHNYYY